LAEKFMFLSPQWIREAVKVVQGARSKDEEFRKLTSSYSLNLAYVITNIPPKLKELYSSEQIILFIQLDKGVVKDFEILAKPPTEKIDFTITSTYSTVKQIFLGQLSATAAFMNRQLKVEPFSTVYRRPRFTAKSIIVGNMILKFCSQIPTEYNST
jgi:putative sterol carrier protein